MELTPALNRPAKRVRLEWMDFNGIRPGNGKYVTKPQTRISHALLPQDPLHRLALGQLVDQLIQIANFTHSWFFYVFHTDTADHTFN